MKIYNRNKGFTLIELLVVISIIGLLSSVVLASLNSARVKARDVRRISDLAQIRNAIELYYNDTGRYPNDPGVGGGTQADCWIGGGNWIPDAGNYNWSVGYISKQPHDPVNDCCWPSGNCGGPADRSGTYQYWSNGQKYMIAAKLENIGHPLRAGVTLPGIADSNCGVLFQNGGCWGLGQYVYAIGN